MSQFAAALAGAVTAVGVGAVAIARSWPGASGRHRAARLASPALPATEALEKTAALCATEGRVTVHARLRVTRDLLCMDCRNTTPDPLPSREEATGA
ncbi:hypothetical protein GTU99_12715 [Streptomyces sp. PRKS01-65]|nr:hypothetical protein [Streptomyces harenosi]NEY33042.1 hypothetical protein [Streptomyces harenosi]